MSTDQAKLSKLLPPSLGTMFDQPFAKIETAMTLPDPPKTLPGAFAAPELCEIVEQYREDLLPNDAVAEVKIDGIRSLYIDGLLWTREGSSMTSTGAHCLPILYDLERAYGRKMFFDGEYVEDGGFESTISAFRSGKGNGCLWLFDAVPFDEWSSGQPSRQPLLQRKAELRRNLMAVTQHQKGIPVGYVEHQADVDRRLAEAYARDLWSAGYEGMVVKSAGSRYVRKRCCDWMKLKIRSTSALEVVDIIGCQRNGTTEAQTLLVRLPGRAVGPKGQLGPPMRPIKLPVPAGGLAETIWQRRGDMIGRNVEVEHAGFTGAGNPREAVLKKVPL